MIIYFDFYAFISRSISSIFIKQKDIDPRGRCYYITCCT